MIDMHMAQGLTLALAVIGFIVLIMSECYYIWSWRETKERFYLVTSIITAILIILFGIGLGICVVDYVRGV